MLVRHSLIIFSIIIIPFDNKKAKRFVVAAAAAVRVRVCDVCLYRYVCVCVLWVMLCVGIMCEFRIRIGNEQIYTTYLDLSTCRF